MHNLLPGICDRVVSLVGRDLDTNSLLAGENVELAIVLVIEVLGAHHGPHLAVVVVLLELLAVGVVVVAEVEQVVGCTALVLLSCIEVVFLHFEHLSLLLVLLLHVFKPAHFPGEALLAQMGPLVLNMVVLLLTHFRVCHCEVLVEPFLF